MILKDNGQDVLKSLELYVHTQDSQEFAKQAGLWCMWYVQKKFFANEDECSELFIKIWTSAEKLLSLYKTGEYRNILGHLAVVAKHFLYLIKRNYKKEELEKEISNFLQVEQIKEQNSSTINSKKNLRALLSSLKIEERVIFCLKYNLPLSLSEKKYLKNLFIGREKEFLELSNLLKEREEKIKQREKKIIYFLNRCNVKILDKTQTYKVDFKTRKLKLLEQLLKREELLTIDEITKYLCITKYKVIQTTRNTLFRLKQEERLVA